MDSGNRGSKTTGKGEIMGATKRFGARLVADGVLLAAALLWTSGTVQAQVSTRVAGGNLSIASFLQADWAFSTSGRSSPYNAHDLSSDGNTWNQMAYRGESLVDYSLDNSLATALGLDSARLFAQPRLYVDLGPEVDGSLKEVNLFGGRNGGRYPGNGWMAQTVGTHEYVLDAKEVFADLRKGPWKLRLGKQQIAWGTALFLRSLDAVNSLDLRRHSIFDVIGNEYADERIGMWTAHLTYEIPKVTEGVSGTSVSAFISPDFEPFILPAAGGSYNILPSQVILNDGANIAQARHKLVYGGVAKATVFDVDFTANFVSTPNTLGVFSFAPAYGPNAVPGSPFIVDPNRGFNSLGDFVSAAKTARLSVPDIATTLMTPPFSVPAALLGDPVALDNFLRSTPVDGVVTRQYPREFIYGGSASYYVQPIHTFPGAQLINGNLFKLEGTYTPSKAFTTPGLSVTPKRVGELNMAIEMEKQVKWNRRIPSAFVVLEYWFKSRSDFFNRYEPAQGESNFQLIGIAMQQGLWGNRIRLDNSLVMDVTSSVGTWLQPGILYKPRDYLQFDLYYNYFQGGSHDIFGPLASFDEIFFKTTYKF